MMFRIGSLTTLHLMRLDRQYEQALVEIEQQINENRISTPPMIATWCSEAIGGLLSAHAVTGNPVYRERFGRIINITTVATQPITGLPQMYFDRTTPLSVVGGFLLEANYLAKITTAGSTQWPQLARDILQFVRASPKSAHMSYDVWSAETNEWRTHPVRNGSTIATQPYRIVDDLLGLYMVSGDAAVEQLLVDHVSSALISILRTDSGRIHIRLRRRSDDLMNQNCCSLGGFFGLLSRNFRADQAPVLMRIAEGLAKTCHDASVLADGVNPHYFRVDAQTGAIDVGSAARSAISNTSWHAVYTYFVLWRLTHDDKYRDWGWETVGGLERASRDADVGYQSQMAYFPAATLKYLYLLYSDDGLLSLDEWAFNRCGQPFPR